MTCASLSAHPLKQKSCTRVRWPDGHIDPGVKLTFIHHLLILADSSVNFDSGLGSMIIKFAPDSVKHHFPIEKNSAHMPSVS